MNKLCVLEVDNTEYKIPEKVIKSYQKLQQENQQLKSMICPIYEKCQKGECDCTHEEYNSMCETNMKMSVELNKYKSILESLYVCLINEYKCYDCEDKEWKFADDIIKRIETLKKYYFEELEEGNSNEN